MEPTTIKNFSAPKGELVQIPQSSKPITASSFELRLGLLAMVRAQSFLGLDYENPYYHLREFEQLCACLTIAGMSQETLRWKLFPFSLNERARQWYDHNIGKVNEDWEDLRNKFCFAFFPVSRITSLRHEILGFQQKENETIGAAWDRFSILTRSGPDLSIPNHVLLQHFWSGLSKASALQLDIAAGGSFIHKTTAEGEALLDRIPENTPPLEPIRVEPEPVLEEVSSAIAETTIPIERPSPEPENPKEDIQSTDLPMFEDDLFEEFGNTSNYTCQKRPPILVTPSDSLDELFLRKSIRELTSILSSEWVTEGELSSEEIQIRAPSTPLRCKIQGEWVDMLYNPTVGANIMSKSFALCLGEHLCTPTVRSLRLAPRSILQGLGILHNITLYHENVEIVLDFHIFDIPDFDVLIGHPLEKLFANPPETGELDINLGKDSFPIQVTRAKNSVAEPPPIYDLPAEVMSVGPIDTLESSLEKDAELFIEEEDELGETVDLPKEEPPTQPPIELKPLPAGLRYVFLNGETQTPVVISNQLSDKETRKLIAVLEKHRSVFGYSL